MQENPVVLKHGVFLAPFHNPVENPTIGLRQDIELARIADDLGYDEYWFGEHHSGGLETISSPELMIAAAAEVTRRIRLGTGVITLPYHNPLMVANRIAQLDHLTRGRAIFGLGPGLLVEDAAMLGIQPGQTRQMMAEAIEVILRLLKGEIVTEKTDWFTLENARLHLLPFTRPHPQIAVASSGTPSGGRTAGKYGFSMLCVAATDIGGFNVLAENWKIAEEMGAIHGNIMDRQNLRLVAPMHIAETREKARENVRYGLERWIRYYSCVAPQPFDTQGKDPVDALVDSGRAVIGTPDDAIALIERLHGKQGDFGVFLHQHVDWADWDQTKKSYELYARYVMPHFSGVNANRLASWESLQMNAADYQEKRNKAAQEMFAKHAADKDFHARTGKP
ncbi:MAG: LLM class flavin-dependent oxidoreductase [Rhizobiaceae bacterium]|nr:LLM class flavin-dependent oxidoreductase [Rhizobiaceae bacterium]